MRFLACLLLLSGFTAVCSCQAPGAAEAVRPAATQPAGPLDTVTDPHNQPGFDAHGIMR